MIRDKAVDPSVNREYFAGSKATRNYISISNVSNHIQIPDGVMVACKSHPDHPKLAWNRLTQLAVPLVFSALQTTSWKTLVRVLVWEKSLFAF